MKIKQAHYQELEKAIDQAITDSNIEIWRANDCRWHLLHSAQFTVRNNIHTYQCNGTAWIVDNLYGYLNDTHIDTALRRIIKTLNRKYFTERGY